MKSDKVALRYKQASVAGAGSSSLVISLYEGALGCLRRARRGIEEKDVVLRGEAIGKAIDYVGELRLSLDFERSPDLASELDAFYQTAIQRLLQANIKGDLQTLCELQEHFEDMLETWKEVLN